MVIFYEHFLKRTTSPTAVASPSLFFHTKYKFSSFVSMPHFPHSLVDAHSDTAKARFPVYTRDPMIFPSSVWDENIQQQQGR